MKKNQIVFYALGIACVFVLTAFGSFPIGVLGYVNIGDALVMLFASIVNPLGAFFVGSIGSAMADLALGYSHYAVFTFLIKGMEGCIVSKIFHSLHKKSYIAYVTGAIIMVLGYALTDIILTQELLMGIESMSMNSIQALISCSIAIVASNSFVSLGHRFHIEE